MILWIAGWPHNGSTLCRQILKDCFDIQSFSIYGDEGLDDLFGPGTDKFAKDWQVVPLQNYLQCARSDHMYFIKTHQLPLDDMPAIFVVRDGRDAISSVSNYWQIPMQYATISQTSLGFCSWSDYYHVWDPKYRAHTIIVRFEDMVERPEIVVEQLETFLQLKALRPYVDDYCEKAKEHPQLFNGRIGVYKDKMTEEDLRLFWKCHGPVMKELGYNRPRGCPERQVIEDGKV